MRGLLRCRELHSFVAQGPQVDTFEQPLAPAQQDRRDRDVQFIDEAFAKILLDGVRPAADAHVPLAGRLARPVKRLANAARYEMKRRAAFHLDRWTCVMRQDEGRNVIWRIISPPAF